jgi:hypothetical protein
MVDFILVALATAAQCGYLSLLGKIPKTLSRQIVPTILGRLYDMTGQQPLDVKVAVVV